MNQQNDNSEVINNFMNQMNMDGDQRMEIGNTTQPPRVGRTMLPPGDVKTPDSHRKKLQANRMKSKDPIPPEQTKKPPTGQ